MRGEILEIDSIDFYDHDELEKLHEKRARKWLKLFLKAKRGDPKAVEAIKKHEADDRVLRARANQTGFYWV